VPRGILPRVKPYAMFLDKGVEMVMPGGTVHAPYSMTDVYMTGGVYWYAARSDVAVKQTLQELRWPHTTNEYKAKEIGIKLDIIKRDMTKKDQEQYYNYGPPSQQAMVLGLIEV
jgi:hypothetical protein